MLRVRTGALRSPGGNLPRVEERAETQVLISETKKYGRVLQAEETA